MASALASALKDVGATTALKLMSLRKSKIMALRNKSDFLTDQLNANDADRIINILEQFYREIHIPDSQNRIDESDLETKDGALQLLDAVTENYDNQ